MSALGPASTESARRTGRPIVAILLVVALAVLAAALIIWGRPLWVLFRNPERIQAAIHRWGNWAPLGLIILQVVQIVVAPLPGNLVAVIGGFLFGFGRGLLLCMIGVVLGAMSAFLLSKLVGRRVLSLMISQEVMDKFDTFVARRGPFYILLLLLVPNPVGDWVFYLAGLTILPLPVFLLLVLVGRIPSNLLEVFVGTQVYRFGSRGYHLAWWQWTMFVAVLVALAVLYYVNRRRIELFLARFIRFPAGEG